MKILHRLKEESLFYHILNFSFGQPTIWLFFWEIGLKSELISTILTEIVKLKVKSFRM